MAERPQRYQFTSHSGINFVLSEDYEKLEARAERLRGALDELQKQAPLPPRFPPDTRGYVKALNGARAALFALGLKEPSDG